MIADRMNFFGYQGVDVEYIVLESGSTAIQSRRASVDSDGSLSCQQRAGRAMSPSPFLSCRMRVG